MDVACWVHFCCWNSVVWDMNIRTFNSVRWNRLHACTDWISLSTLIQKSNEWNQNPCYVYVCCFVWLCLPHPPEQQRLVFSHKILGVFWRSSAGPSSSSFLAMLDLQSGKAKSAVCRSVSTGPQSFLLASTGLGHVWRLKASKVGQDCRMWLGVRGPVPHGH